MEKESTHTIEMKGRNERKPPDAGRLSCQRQSVLMECYASTHNRRIIPWQRSKAGLTPYPSFTVISYLKLSGSKGSTRPSVVSACGYMKYTMGGFAEPGRATSGA